MNVSSKVQYFEIHTYVVLLWKTTVWLPGFNEKPHLLINQTTSVFRYLDWLQDEIEICD